MPRTPRQMAFCAFNAVTHRSVLPSTFIAASRQFPAFHPVWLSTRRMYMVLARPRQQTNAVAFGLKQTPRFGDGAKRKKGSRSAIMFASCAHWQTQTTLWAAAPKNHFGNKNVSSGLTAPAVSAVDFGTCFLCRGMRQGPRNYRQE